MCSGLIFAAAMTLFFFGFACMIFYLVAGPSRVRVRSYLHSHMHARRAVLTSEQVPVRLGFSSVYLCMFFLAKVLLIVVDLGLTWAFVCILYIFLVVVNLVVSASDVDCFERLS